MKYPIILLALLAGFTGCKRYYCHAQESICAYVSRDWKSFSDSTATVIRYQKYSRLAITLDSAVNKLVYQKDPNCPFWTDAGSNLTPEYDYKIIFRPSGVQRSITNITIDRDKVPRGTDGVVSCGGSYTVDVVTTNVSDYLDDETGYTVSTIQIYLYE